MKNLIAVFGCLLIMVLFIFAYVKESKLFKRCNVETIAKVVDIDVTRDSDGDTTYYPILEYKVGKKDIQSKSRNGYGSSPYDINENVGIRYNKNKPTEFVFKNEKVNIAIIFAIGLAAIGFIFSIINFVKGLKTDENGPADQLPPYQEI